jgi:hypothetical protein
MGGLGDVTPELLRHIQHRYEETDEPVRLIAADTQVRERRIYELAAQLGWRKRRDRPPRDVSPELRLTHELDRALEEADGGASDRHSDREGGLRPAPTDSALLSDVEAGLEPAPTTPASTADDASPTSVDLLAVAARLERQLEQNLARVERMREMQWPQGPADAERTTRALERLTDALLKVRRLRNPDTNMAGGNGADRNDFDMPGDIDEFRRKLARRIDAFVRSRTGADVPGPGEGRGAP